MNPKAAMGIVNIKDQLQPMFKKYQGKILFAYCFGSTVTGSKSALSDIDLAFYMHSEFTGLDIKLQLITDIMRTLNRNDIDVVILNTLQNLVLADSIVRDGVLLLDTHQEERHQYEVSVTHRALDFLTQRKTVMGL